MIGRVARRLWSSIAFKYGANKNSQRLKYHIQTSGRSLRAGNCLQRYQNDFAGIVSDL
ncbi:MAG: methylmalonyl-CoA mutase family protein [Saprospiraceae bacterium]